jgi:pyruvate/2-oxoacid:ferredoxin oxidoreductase beta subunit
MAVKPNIIDVNDLLKRQEHHTVLYFNYDNEAFMNTGIQESGSTPFACSTTTGPGGEEIKGKVGVKQDILNPMAFLGTKSSFFASASLAYPLDFMGKVIEAMKTPGGGFIQSFSPCPRGWRSDAHDSFKIAKLATDSGYYPLITIRVKDGVPKWSYSRPLKFNREKFLEFIKTMGKYNHLFKPKFEEDLINELIQQTEARLGNMVALVDNLGAEAPMDVYKMNVKQFAPQTHLAPGYGLCPGCGAGSIIHLLTLAATQVAKNNILYVNNTCCLEVATSKDDLTSWKSSWMHHLFESGATVADAIATTYRMLRYKGIWKKEIPYVIHLAGDGSTYDIGYQFLKSAIVRSSSFTIQNRYCSDDYCE